jgi:hypothetical protein
MSLAGRRELTDSIRERYVESSRSEKTRILDELTLSTGYSRKHAIAVLRQGAGPSESKPRRRSCTPRLYSEEVREALVSVWEACDRLCSKRLVPYLPRFLPVLERCGHLKISTETRRRLLRISPATVDRLLYEKRHAKARSLVATRPGSLLKHQIPVRTFTDWNDDRVGFLEADSVAHCGSSMAGTFLNTLVLTDIKTGWTECLALLYKDQDFVVQAIAEARCRFPFPVRGLDTDNGSEFMTNKLLAYCEQERLTFTRSRPYKKNDQCFVEQKNGSIVRRLVGYDRYEGIEPARIMAELYSVIRLWSNFFQPSMRLVSKSRRGAKTRRIYDTPRTPYDRVLSSIEVAPSLKASLRRQYRGLDPVALLERLKRLQDELWTHGYRELPSRAAEALPAIPAASIEGILAPEAPPNDKEPREYHKTKRRHKKHKKHKSYVHWWRTCPDPFEHVWSECEQELAKQSNLAATVLLERLQARYPGQYDRSKLRTLQRRVRAWRIAQMHVPMPRTPRRDAVPDINQIELAVHCPISPAAETLRYDFE